MARKTSPLDNPPVRLRKTQAMRARPRTSLALKASRPSTEQERKLELQYIIDSFIDDYPINFAVIQTPQSTQLPRGENAAQSLSHVNLVRAFKALIPEDSKGSTVIELPEGGTSNSTP